MRTSPSKYLLALCVAGTLARRVIKFELHISCNLLPSAAICKHVCNLLPSTAIWKNYDKVAMDIICRIALSISLHHAKVRTVNITQQARPSEPSGLWTPSFCREGRQPRYTTKYT